MNVILISFESVFTLLGIGILGFWLIGRRHVPAATLGFLSALAIDIALPFLVLASLIKDFSPEKLPGWWNMPLWWLGFTAVALALSLAASVTVKKEIRSEFTISALYQNGIFFPIIIVNGLFGAGNLYLLSIFIFTAIQPSFVFSTYTMFFGKKMQPQKLSWRRIINPMLVTTFLGLIISLASLKSYVPQFIVTIVAMVGAMATPLFMLILGGNVYNDFMYKVDGKKRFDVWEVVKFVAVKNLVFPLVFLGILVWLRPDTTTAFVIILQAAVPPITAVPIFAERCGGNRAITSQFIVGSFIFSVVSIPAVIYLFSRFFTLPLM